MAFALLALSAQAQSLSLDEAQRRAVQRSQQVAVRNLAITVSREMSVAAGQLPDPVLKVGAPLLSMFVIPAAYLLLRRRGLRAGLATVRETEVMKGAQP